MPYANPDRQRQAARESARRRRLARRGATSIRVEPLNRDRVSGGLTAFELGKLLAEEIHIIRAAMRPGEPERARVLVQLCTAALRAFESGDLAAKVEHLERMFAGLAEDGRRTIRAV